MSIRLVGMVSLLVVGMGHAAQQVPALKKVHATGAAYAIGAFVKDYATEKAKDLTTRVRTTAEVDKGFVDDLVKHALDELGILDEEKRLAMQPVFDEYFAGRIQRNDNEEREAQHTVRTALFPYSESEQAQAVLAGFFERVKFYCTATHKWLEKSFERAIMSGIKELVVSPFLFKDIVADYDAGTKFSLISKLAKTPYNDALAFLLLLDKSKPLPISQFELQLSSHSGTASWCGAQDPFCYHSKPYKVQPGSLSAVLLDPYKFVRIADIAMSVGGTIAVLALSNWLVTQKILSPIDKHIAQRMLNADGFYYMAFTIAKKIAEKFCETLVGGELFWYAREFFYACAHKLYEVSLGRSMTIAEELELRKECDWWERLMFAYSAGAFGGQKDFVKKFFTDVRNRHLN